MRRAQALVLLALVGLAATPSAGAATFDLGASKIIEHALEPGTSVAFEMPLTVNQAGFLYGKVLPTPGNAVNDGSRSNGSVSDARGWRVSFAMKPASGERIEMGTFVDSTTSQLVPVAIGDKPTFIATVHIPADAARGGPQQKVYVAIAYRLNGGSSVGGASGAAIDEARALTLVLSNALLPPALVDTLTPAPEGSTSPPTGTGTGTGTGSTDPAPVTDDPGVEKDDSATDATDDASVPPVAPIATGRSGTVNVSVAPLPTWFLAGMLGVGLVLAIALALMSLAIFGLVRTLRLREAAASIAARDVPVKNAAIEKRRVEISAPEE